MNVKRMVVGYKVYWWIHRKRRIQDGLFSIRRNLNVGGVRGGYHHGLRETRSAWASKQPAARCERTCLKWYARCLCVPQRTSKLAKKPAGTQEEHLKLTVTDVGNIYNMIPPWRWTLLPSLLELRLQIYSHPSINVNILYIYARPRTQLTFSNTRHVIRPVPIARQGFPPFLIFSNRSHLFMSRINVVWDSWGEEQIIFRRTKESAKWLMLRSSTSCSLKRGMNARKNMVFTLWKYGLQM